MFSNMVNDFKVVPVDYIDIEVTHLFIIFCLASLLNPAKTLPNLFLSRTRIKNTLSRGLQLIKLI